MSFLDLKTDELVLLVTVGFIGYRISTIRRAYNVCIRSFHFHISVVCKGQVKKEPQQRSRSVRTIPPTDTCMLHVKNDLLWRANFFFFAKDFFFSVVDVVVVVIVSIWNASLDVPELSFWKISVTQLSCGSSFYGVTRIFSK